MASDIEIVVAQVGLHRCSLPQREVPCVQFVEQVLDGACHGVHHHHATEPGLAREVNEAERDFPQPVADALVELAGSDRIDYSISVETILWSFEQRTEFLEDIPVADTVLVLQRLAAMRDLTADLAPSPVLP